MSSSDTSDSSDDEESVCNKITMSLAHTVTTSVDDLIASLEAYKAALPQLHTLRLCLKHGTIKIPLEIQEMIEQELVISYKDLNKWTVRSDCFQSSKDPAPEWCLHYIHHTTGGAKHFIEKYASQSCQDCVDKACNMIQYERITGNTDCSHEDFEKWARREWQVNKALDGSMVHCIYSNMMFLDAVHRSLVFDQGVLRIFGLRTVTSMYLKEQRKTGRKQIYLQALENEPLELSHKRMWFFDKRRRTFPSLACANTTNVRLARMMKALSLDMFDPYTSKRFTSPRAISCRLTLLTRIREGMQRPYLPQHTGNDKPPSSSSSSILDMLFLPNSYGMKKFYATMGPRD